MPTLEDGKNAVAQGNLQQARLIFEAILQDNPRSEDAWLGLAEVLTDTKDKRICYENVLKINKNSQRAKEGLRNLEPQQDPLVAALAQQAVRQEPDEEDVGEVEEEPPESSPARAPASTDEEGSSMGMLVAVGLALSVVVFAIGGGVVYFVVTSLLGG